MELRCRNVRLPFLDRNPALQPLDHWDLNALSRADMENRPLSSCRVVAYREGRIVSLSPQLEILLDRNLVSMQVKTLPLNHVVYSQELRAHPAKTSVARVSVSNTGSRPRTYLLDFSAVKKGRLTFFRQDRMRAKAYSEKLAATLSALPKGAKLIHGSSQSWKVELAPGQRAEVSIQIIVSRQCRDVAGVLSDIPSASVTQLENGDSQKDVDVSVEKLTFPPMFLVRNVSGDHVVTWYRDELSHLGDFPEAKDCRLYPTGSLSMGRRFN
jgi:hypothetical protein